MALGLLGTPAIGAGLAERSPMVCLYAAWLVRPGMAVGLGAADLPPAAGAPARADRGVAVGGSTRPIGLMILVFRPIAHRFLGHVYTRAGEYYAAHQHLVQALAWSERLCDVSGQIHAHWSLAWVWADRGGHAACRRRGHSLAAIGPGARRTGMGRPRSVLIRPCSGAVPCGKSRKVRRFGPHSAVPTETWPLTSVGEDVTTRSASDHHATSQNPWLVVRLCHIGPRPQPTIFSRVIL